AINPPKRHMSRRPGSCQPAPGRSAASRSRSSTISTGRPSAGSRFIRRSCGYSIPEAIPRRQRTCDIHQPLRKTGHIMANNTVRLHRILAKWLPTNGMRVLAGVSLLLAGTAMAPALAGNAGFAQGRVIDGPGAVLAPRDRVEPENRMLRERLDTLLPALMQEAGLDMWLVINREYAEDPVYLTLVPQPAHAARRTTMLVFHRQADGSVRRLSINRYPFGDPYETAWSGGDETAQWQALGEVIVAVDPKRIGINVSEQWPVADGLTHGLHEQLLQALPEDLATRLVPAEQLVVRWLETRSESERAVYPHIVALARGVISEAFSNRVITPGATTTEDVAWYIHDRFE